MTAWTWLDEAVALAIHQRSLVAHGGADGVRDRARLQAALARPQQHEAYHPGVDACALAAVYTGGIVLGHPFVDGNKRTGFLLGALFLELNGLRLLAHEDAAASAVIALASGTLSEAEYEAFLRANVQPGV